METNGQYIVILDWMPKQLKLKGAELIIYALIHGFCQNTPEHNFRGSLKYLSDWTAVSVQAVMAALQKLTQKGLLLKNDIYINNVKYCSYKSVLPSSRGMQETCIPCKKLEEGYTRNLNEGMQETLDNNISDIINDNIDICSKSEVENQPELLKADKIESADKSAEDKDAAYDYLFQKFWAAYPRKVAKKTAYKAWRKIKKMNDVLFGKIMVALQLQKEQRQWQKVEFIPHAATWLNRESWLDDLGNNQELQSKLDRPDESSPINRIPEWFK